MDVVLLKDAAAVHNRHPIGPLLLDKLRHDQSDLCNRPQGCVTLKCTGGDGNEIRMAHRIVLKASSKYFVDVFRTYQGGKIPLPVSGPMFDHILRYIYTRDHIEIKIEQSLELLAAAKQLELDKLADKVISFIKANAETFIKNIGKFELSCDNYMRYLDEVLPELCVDQHMQLELISQVQLWGRKTPQTHELSLNLIGLTADSSNVLRFLVHTLRGRLLLEIKDGKLASVPFKDCLGGSKITSCVMQGRKLFACQPNCVIVFDVLVGTNCELTVKRPRGVTIFNDAVYIWNESSVFVTQGRDVARVGSYCDQTLEKVSIVRHDKGMIHFVAQTSTHQVVEVTCFQGANPSFARTLVEQGQLVGVLSEEVYVVEDSDEDPAELIVFHDGTKVRNSPVKVHTNSESWLMFVGTIYQVWIDEAKFNSRFIEAYDVASRTTISLSVECLKLIIVPSRK